MLQRMLVWLAFVSLAGLNMASSQAMAASAPLLDALFSDHVVLQRDRPMDIRGNAAAGEEVVVTMSGATVKTRADAQGRWNIQFPEMPAGGPHTLTARTAGRMQNVHDVLIGDVWLCSGQSNMVWSVRASLDSRAEIAGSANDGIRMLTIANAASAVPIGAFQGPLEWKVANPENTGNFSAACYFFARELQKTVGVPHGFIVSAWGGSKIQPWMSEWAVRDAGGNDAALAVLARHRDDPSAAAAQWGEMWQSWWQSQGAATAGKQPWARVRGDEAAWTAAPAELTPWESWGVPALARFDGMVWYRTSVRLSAAQAKQAATVSLGPVDEVDLTWVNGRVVGSSSGGGDRRYPLPAGLLVAGENFIVVNALDTYSSGGMYGPTEKRAIELADGTRVPLAGWRYQVAPRDLTAPRAPWEPTAGLSMIYNAMIAPLGRFGLRGVAWYQGESNTSIPEGRRYQRQLAALMADWRRQFDAPLPFMVVQLANYGATNPRPVESGWALTRDAQRRAVVADGNAALVVTIDIGNRDDVHPTNKQELGRRLARAARHVVYGEKISASGAQPKSASRAPQTVQVTLADHEGQLVVVGSRDPAGFELCGAAQDSCHFVRAELAQGGEGGRIMLETGSAREQSALTRVRFCWADSPLCNLYDAAGLPVGPFEIAIE